MISRLAIHLPRGNYLRRLAHGIVLSKASYAAASTIRPRLTNQDRPHSAAIKAAQISINDTARSLTGHTRRDHIDTALLLDEAGIPSINRIAVRSVAIEAWKAYHSVDHSANRNLLGLLTFGKANDDYHHHDISQQDPLPQRILRSQCDGLVPVTLRGHDTFACYATKMWNEVKELREATSLAEATSVAKKMAKKAPP